MFLDVKTVNQDPHPVTPKVPSQVVEQPAPLGSVCGTRGQTGGVWHSSGPAWTTVSGSPGLSPVNTQQPSEGWQELQEGWTQGLSSEEQDSAAATQQSVGVA